MSFYQDTIRRLQKMSIRRELAAENQSSSTTATAELEAEVTAPEKSESAETASSRSSDCLTETELIRELLFAFQGISGRVLVKSPQHHDTLQFQLSAKVEDEATRQKVLHLAVLGTMFQSLQLFIEQNSIDGVSMFQSAMAAALQEQLGGFYFLLSHIESQLSGDQADLTLTRLRAETFVAKRHLQWLVTAVEACRHSTGCNVLSTLHFILQNGDPRAFTSLSPIYLKVSEAFYELLKSWFSCSKLVDPHCEFFISAKLDDDVKGEDFFFTNQYFTLNDLMTPQFLTEAQINRILEVGKNFCWLKAIVGARLPDLYRDLDRVIRIVTTDPEEGVRAWSVGGKMHSFLMEMESSVAMALTQALLTEGKLLTHLDTLTGFLLLRQSGFAAQLISQTFDMLCAPAAKLSLCVLREKFRHAVNSAATEEQEEICPERILDVVYEPRPEDDMGWDTFEVKYRVEKSNPVSLVLTEDVLEKYYCFFKEILKLRRMEWMLCDILKSVKTTYRKFHQITGEQKIVLNHIHLLAQEMHLLNQQVLNNILRVRLEVNWHQFVEQIKSADSLTALRERHNKYLSNLEIFMFPGQMHDLLQQTFELNDLYQSFLVAFKSPTCEWNTSGDASCGTATPSKSVFCPASVPKRLKTLRHNFHELVVQFLSIIKLRPEEDMQHLYELINLNDFYESA